jgi:thioredoxin reductase (NADPH)
MTDQTPAVVETSRPVLLAVDDEPSVARAVERDLRRRYGRDYRVLRAGSGEEALATLREAKLRGTPIALLLVDQRMPGMSGVELLEAAREIAPSAKSALLTAYADTQAAIDAINRVSLDHYLLKPWDPPEEQLYPVIDDLLDAWRAEAPPDADRIQLVGHRWSRESHDARDFLARNQVPFQWLDVEREDEARRLLAAAEGDGVLPLVLFPDGGSLHGPTITELAERTGVLRRAERPFYDLVIVGGGPAGLAAAVYGASEGLQTALVERDAPGGQAGQSSRIENYLGFPDGVSGAQLTERARRQAVKFGAELITTRDVVALEANGAGRTVRFADGAWIDGHTVILATGVSYRQLGATGLDRLTGRGVYYGSALTEAANCAEQDVYIVGGANSAGQAAVYLSRGARSVTILVRGKSLQESMSYYLIQQLSEIKNIKVRTCVEVIEAHGDDHLEHLTLRDSTTGDIEHVDAGWLFVFIGALPRTDWLDGMVIRDRRGFVIAGPDLTVDGQPIPGWDLDRQPFHLETSVPGVFVAGDARAESAKRVASAVGEGAMAVMLVHRYLEGL